MLYFCHYETESKWGLHFPLDRLVRRCSFFLFVLIYPPARTKTAPLEGVIFWKCAQPWKPWLQSTFSTQNVLWKAIGVKLSWHAFPANPASRDRTRVTTDPGKWWNQARITHLHVRYNGTTKCSPKSCHFAQGIFHFKQTPTPKTYSWEAGRAETNRQDDTLSTLFFSPQNVTPLLLGLYLWRPVGMEEKLRDS